MPNLLPTADQIDAVLKEATADPYHSLPRAVVLAANKDGIIYSGASGYHTVPTDPSTPAAELAAAEPVTEDSIFTLWSCTKLVAVVAALQLIEQGLIKVEDEAGEYLKELRNVKVLKGFTENDEPILEELESQITVEQLITHTSGSSYSEPLLLKYAQVTGRPGAYTKDWTADIFLATPLLQQPGTHFVYGYSNDYLSHVVEKVSGLDFNSYVKQNIFGPLGVTDVSFDLPAKKVNIAHDEGPDKPFRYDVGVQAAYPHPSGGAGLFGSPKSYLALTHAILRGGVGLNGTRILKDETVKLMLTPHLKTDQQRQDATDFGKDGSDPSTRLLEKANPGVESGYGGFLCPQDLSSGRKKGTLTWSGMANTFWFVDPTSELTAVLFFNVIPFGHKVVFDTWYKVEKLLYEGLATLKQ